MTVDANKARTIFLSAVDHYRPDQWPGLLDKACGANAELRRRVEALLKAHQEDDSVLDRGGDSPPATAAASRAPAAKSPGHRIGPYKLLQKIGDGGMGVVYMAEQTEPVQRRVALKIIKPGMDSRQVIARFEAERHALALMDHPNIARVLDAGTTDSGRPYFVMELVKGVPITQYCDEHKLTPRERLELFVPVCHAVQHAHQKGIIHRDLKPSNVLVAEYDDRPVPKIIDFGVAKAIQQRLTQRTMFTQMGQVVGTVDYMSPEQAKLNQLDIDTRSDIYSLGVILYELLTGQTPFDRQRLHSAAFDELLRIIREEEPPRPSTRLSGSESLPAIAASRRTEGRKLSTLVHGELDWIVMKAMEKDRGRRYETANAFAADVEHYLRDEPVIACPASAGYRFRKFARRNRPLLVMAGVVGAILVLASIVSTWQAVRATQARGEARQRADEATLAKGEAERAAAEAQAVSDFLVNDLLSSAKPEVALGREVTVKEVLANAEKTIATAFKDQPLREAAVHHAMGMVYPSLGDYGAAKRHARRAMELRIRILGSEHRETLYSISSLGVVLSSEGYSEQARSLHEQALAGRKRIFGPEHPETLRSMVNLALADIQLGRLDEAQKLLEESLVIQKRLLGPEDPTVLSTMHNLGGVLAARHEWERARRLHEEILAIRRRVLGPEHPDTLKSMGLLGIILIDEGRLDDARKVLEQAIEIEKRILGPEHPSTLYTCNRLARALWTSGKADEACRLCEEIVAIQKRFRGDEHPHTLLSMNQLANALSYCGRHDESHRLYEQVLDVQKRVLGPEHPATLQSMYNVGNALRGMSKPEEARRVLQETILLQERILGSQHPETMYSRHNLALALCDLGQTSEGCRLIEENLAIQRGAFGPTHPDTLRSMSVLAGILHRCGRKEEAQKLCEELREIAPEYSGTLAALVNYADDLRTRGKAAEARKLQEEILAAQRRTLGPEHPDTLANMHNLALSLWKLGQPDDARRLFEQTLDIQQRVLGPDNAYTVLTKRNLERLLHETRAQDPGSTRTQQPSAAKSAP